MNQLTKQQQKEEAGKDYWAIVDLALKDYEAIADPALEAYKAKLRQINAQKETI